MYIIIEIIFIVRYSTSNRESRKNITIKIKKEKIYKKCVRVSFIYFNLF